MKAKRLPVGSHVLVTSVLVRQFADDQKTVRWSQEPCAERHAIITGYSRRYDGVRKPGGYSGGYSGEPDYEPPYLSVTGSHEVYLVRFGAWNREVAVPLVAVTATSPRRLAGRANRYEMEDRWRQELSKDSKLWPRDARGRWLKEQPAPVA